MKHIYKYLVFLLLPFLANCSDNENWTIVTDVQPGTYITGSATMYSGEAPASALKVFPLDGNADGLSELVGIYTWLKADGDFSISIATDLNEVVKYGKGDEVKVANNISVYTLVQDASPFTVNEDGFYFIVVNTSLKEINILPVNYGIIGAATALGWNAETPFDAPTFDGKLTVTWEGTVNLTAGEYKFRYGGDWGNYVNVSDGTTARLFTDLGNIGTSAAPLIENSLSQIKPGGANFSTSFGGQFEFTIQYDLRSRTFNATYALIGGPVILQLILKMFIWLVMLLLMDGTTLERMPLQKCINLPVEAIMRESTGKFFTSKVEKDSKSPMPIGAIPTWALVK